MGEKVKVIVTGGHDLKDAAPVVLKDGRHVEWLELNLLRFERLNVEKTFFQNMTKAPFDWIIFTSARTVQFWTDILREQSMKFPLETQVAAIGENTAAKAEEAGYLPDFYPTEPGSEAFFTEFKDLIINNADKPRVLIPQAENGRTYLKDKLEQLGCQVTLLPIYHTSPLEEIGEKVSVAHLEDAALLLFTSPSSFIAFQKHFRLPKKARLGAIGKYTFNFLLQNGVPADLLPGGAFERVGEIL